MIIFDSSFDNEILHASVRCEQLIKPQECLKNGYIVQMRREKGMRYWQGDLAHSHGISVTQR